jgi:hypothetical protein
VAIYNTRRHGYRDPFRRPIRTWLADYWVFLLCVIMILGTFGGACAACVHQSNLRAACADANGVWINDRSSAWDGGFCLRIPGVERVK